MSRTRTMTRSVGNEGEGEGGGYTLLSNQRKAREGKGGGGGGGGEGGEEGGVTLGRVIPGPGLSGRAWARGGTATRATPSGPMLVVPPREEAF